jgi:hypothetical protein
MCHEKVGGRVLKLHSSPVTHYLPLKLALFDLTEGGFKDKSRNFAENKEFIYVEKGVI